MLSHSLQPNLDCLWFEHWLPGPEADLLLQQALALAWQQESLSWFGKEVVVPRKVLWIADASLHYRYSGKDHAPSAWPEFLLALRLKLQGQFSQSFNSVLANLYENGTASMGYHQDNEPELGRQPVIASLSLGATRRFLFKQIKTGERLSLDLAHGSLLLMYGNSQSLWRHALPKSKRVNGARVNFTFRTIL